MDHAALLRAPRATLLRLLQDGHPLQPAALGDAAYRGISLGLPAVVDRLAWKTFMKVFIQEEGHTRGFNVRLVQQGLGGPPVPMTRRGQPLCFGHFAVRPLIAGEAPHDLQHGVVLDYGQGGNGALDPACLLRDPVVALEAGSVDRLLGWTYIRIAGRNIVTPSFFILQRLGEPPVRAVPPRSVMHRR